MKTKAKKEYKCSISYTLGTVGGKWKWAILWHISKDSVIRYSRLKEELQRIAPIAHKTLSQQLKELELSGLIHREQYNEVPPRVEYSLTEKGKTLIPILTLMAEWGRINMNPDQN